MLQAYFDEGLEDTAVFEFFVRKLPSERNFLLAAGLAQVLDYLEELRFTSDEIEWIASTGRYPPAFLDYLGALRFRGSVYAMPEGERYSLRRARSCGSPHPLPRHSWWRLASSTCSTSRS